MDYDLDYHLSVSDRLDNLYKTNLISRSFAALLGNLMYERRKCLLEQILQLYRRKSLLKRGFSALREQIQIRKFLYTIADRQLIGNFLLRWHAHFEGRSNIRNFKCNRDLNLLKKCFNLLYQPVTLKIKWQETIGKVEALLFVLNYHSFISELSYYKCKQDTVFVAQSHYNSKMLKKVFNAFTMHFEYNYRIDAVEKILYRCLYHNFFVKLHKINTIVDKENTDITLFKKRLVLNAWRRVVLEEIAEKFHNVYSTRIFLICWYNTARKMHQLNVRYNKFTRKINFNIVSNVFNKILKVMEHRKNIICYFNFLESVFWRILMQIVFDNLRFNLQIEERLKLMIKTSEVAYVSSLKSKSMNSIINYLSYSRKKKRLKEIEEVWSVNSLKSKYFYKWQSEIIESNAKHICIIQEFTEAMLIGIKRRYFTYWLKFSVKMGSLRYVIDEFAARDRDIVLSYYWNLWVKKYAANKQKLLELFIENDIFDEFNRIIALYPRQILLLFSSTCGEGMKNISTIGTKILSRLIESLDSPLPTYYDRFSNYTITCRFHDKPKYWCLLKIPKWKNKLISSKVKYFKQALYLWRKYVSEKLAEKKKTQALVDYIDKKRNKRLISCTFYAWVELMAACYAKKREQFLAMVEKICTSIEKPITKEIRYFIYELKEFKYVENYQNNLLHVALSSFRKQNILKRISSMVNERHKNYMLKYFFFEWGNYVFDRQIKLTSATQSMELAIKRRFFGYIKLSIIVLEVTKLHDINSMKYHLIMWTKVKLSINFEKKVLNNFLVEVINAWRNIAHVGMTLKGLEPQINGIYESKLLNKSFHCWLTFVTIRTRLIAASSEIENKNRINSLKIIFSAWLYRANLIRKINYFVILRERRYATSIQSCVFHHLAQLPKLAKIKARLDDRLLSFTYISWKNAVDRIRFYNRIEMTLYNKVKDECQLFIFQLKQFNSWYNALQQNDKNSTVYRALESLGNISRWRMELGLRSLELNVKIRQGKMMVNARKLSCCFKVFYNNYVVERNKRDMAHAFENNIMNKVLGQYLHAWINVFKHKVSIRQEVEHRFRIEEVELLRIYFSSWRKYMADGESKVKLQNVIVWSERRRAAEGFRRLRQFTMEKKWQTVCSHQASIFRAIRDISRTKIAFSAWRNAIVNKSVRTYDLPKDEIL